LDPFFFAAFVNASSLLGGLCGLGGESFLLRK